MSNTVDNSKRRFLTTAASVVVGGAGAAAIAVPFVTSMLPSAKARAAGAPVEVDISKLEVGQMITVEWRGKPVWLINRSSESLETLPKLNEQLADPASDMEQQPGYCKNENRSIRDNVIVLVGICTHLGCSPSYRPELAPADLGPEWKGGFFCPCHGSRYDLSGRVFKKMPAPKNLVVPPYHFLGDFRVVIGEDPQGAA